MQRDALGHSRTQPCQPSPRPPLAGPICSCGSRAIGLLLAIHHHSCSQHRFGGTLKPRHPTETNETSLFNWIFFFFFPGKIIWKHGGGDELLLPAWVGERRLRCTRGGKQSRKAAGRHVGMEHKAGGWRRAADEKGAGI